jgi:DNA-directed RNA polymerase sigma subunit (sigma70/sigma32)
MDRKINDIEQALATLTPSEADILRKSYGCGTPKKTLDEIAADFKPSPREADILRRVLEDPDMDVEEKQNLTRKYVRELKENAIRKLMMRAEQYPEFREYVKDQSHDGTEYEELLSMLRKYV